jgi:hypothetical protein
LYDGPSIAFRVVLEWIAAPGFLLGRSIWLAPDARVHLVSTLI